MFDNGTMADRSSWQHLFNSTGDTHVGYVTTSSEFHELKKAFEVETNSIFVSVKTSSSLGKTDIGKKKHRIVWPDDGSSPYYTLYVARYECLHGPDRNRTHKIKYKERHKASVKKRVRLQPTKKVECPAVIKAKEVIVFTQYQGSCYSDWKRRHVAQLIKNALDKNDENIKFERRILVSLPKGNDHKNHADNTHSSVRIKGTEHNYEPSTCTDPKCTKSWPHMHCPFCVKSEVFQDPVILKAHYRVKHVDKGIEFAGLKILRCCEQCDIVGTIKGTKEFKGAHWHCYKCRNGFTRRDEAIKHYRTHFRNPSTTFQIQVSQDITQSSDINFRETSVAADGIPQALHLEAVVTEPGDDDIDDDSYPATSAPITSISLDKSNSGDLHVSVAANETVDACEGQTIMIIQDGTTLDGEIVGTIQQALPVQHQQILSSAKKLHEIPVSKVPTILSSNIHWRKEKLGLEQKVRELQAQNEKLLSERTQTEQQLGEEIIRLKDQIQVMSTEIVAYQKREEELVEQLKIPLDDRITSLLSELKDQHEELLHRQLAQVRRACFLQHSANSFHQEEPEDQAGESQEMNLDSQVTDMNLVVQDDTHVLATVDGTRTVVIHRDGHTYSAVTQDGLNLTSESLLNGNSHTSPIFVMSHTLQGVKVENEVTGSVEETIEDRLLQHESDHSPMVHYTTEVPSGHYITSEVTSGDYTVTEVTPEDQELHHEVTLSVVEDVSENMLTVEQVSDEQLEKDSDIAAIHLGISGKRKVQFTEGPKSKHPKE